MKCGDTIVLFSEEEEEDGYLCSGGYVTSRAREAQHIEFVLLALLLRV
jgi:hypothetical protein